jgi:hypothetical protein
MSHYTALWVAAVTGAGCAVISLVVVMPILKKRADAAMAQKYDSQPIHLQCGVGAGIGVVMAVACLLSGNCRGSGIAWQADMS